MSTTKQAIEQSVNHINKIRDTITCLEREIIELQRRREILKTSLRLAIKDHRELCQLINERPDFFEDKYE